MNIKRKNNMVNQLFESLVQHVDAVVIIGVVDAVHLHEPYYTSYFVRGNGEIDYGII